MLARVATFQGGDPDAVRATAREIASRAEEGPPEGVPATGFMLLTGDDGSVIAIALFANEDDLRAGDAALNEMSPPGDGMGARASVKFYEVAVDVRS
jgi:hypothetical protein